MGNQSQIVQSTDMRRLLGEDLPVNLLSLLQSPGLMMPHRKTEGLLDIELGHVLSKL